MKKRNQRTYIERIKDEVKWRRLKDWEKEEEVEMRMMRNRNRKMKRMGRLRRRWG